MNGKIKTALAIILAASAAATVLTACTNTKKTPDFPENAVSYVSDYKKLSDYSLNGTVKFKKGESFELDFGKDVTFDTVSLYEKGDNCREFSIYIQKEGGDWELAYKQDRIMAYHLCYLGEVTACKMRIEITDSVNDVALREVCVYQAEKADKKLKVTQYLRFDAQDFSELIGNEGFSGYYDVVTDPIIFGAVYLDENANVCFYKGEEQFASQLENLRKIIGERNVNIRCCIFFDQYGEDRAQSLDNTKDFVNNNIDKINENIKAFVEKYGIYGIDYDWEYPTKNAQWKAYDLIITQTAKYTKVSVAVPPWQIKLGKSARECVEIVNVMAYDLFDELNDHSNYYNAGYEAISKVRSFGFKSEQIAIGIPTYARTVDRSEYAWPTVREDGKSLGEWGKIVKDYEYTDKNTNEIKHSDGYLNSYAEVRDKTATAIDENIGGVMIFRAFCDSEYTDEYCRTRAIGEVISERSSPVSAENN